MILLYCPLTLPLLRNIECCLFTPPPPGRPADRRRRAIRPPCLVCVRLSVCCAVWYCRCTTTVCAGGGLAGAGGMSRSRRRCVDHHTDGVGAGMARRSAGSSCGLYYAVHWPVCLCVRGGLPFITCRIFPARLGGPRSHGY